MDSVLAVFEMMKESTWIETLMYSYDYPEFSPSNPDMLGQILMELPESTWAEDLFIYRTNIEDAGIKFLTVLDMRNIFLETIITENTVLGRDVAALIAVSV